MDLSTRKSISTYLPVFWSDNCLTIPLYSRTDLYLHFVNREDNSILEVNDVLSLIDKNIEYLDELYKEFNVLVTEVSSVSNNSYIHFN